MPTDDIFLNCGDRRYCTHNCYSDERIAMQMAALASRVEF